MNAVINKLGYKYNRKMSRNDLFIGVAAIVFIVAVMCLFTLPMAVKRGSYLFTINDNLDSYAGNVQIVHYLKNYFNVNEGQSFTGGLNNHYSTISILQVYSMLCCFFGFLDGQIITRFFSVIVGFFSMRLLIHEIFPERSYYQSILLSMTACVYSVTSSAPNRQIAYATLPLIVFAFIRLSKEQKYTPLLFLTAFYPMVTNFNAIHVFVMIFWMCFTCVDAIVKRKININLALSFAVMGLSTLLVFQNTLRLSLLADETNRSLFKESIAEPKFDWDMFCLYLFSGQYHSATSHGILLLPVLLTFSIAFLVLFVFYKEFRQKNMTSAWVLLTGWLLWLFSAFIATFQESGFKSGITLIDGFQWGRLISFMRLCWYLMMAAIIMVKPIDNMNPYLVGIVPVVALCLHRWLPYPSFFFSDLLGYIEDANLLKKFGVLIVVMMVLIGISMMHKYRVVSDVCICFVLGLQVFFILISSNIYNDVGYNLFGRYPDYAYYFVSVDDFFSTELFDQIKEDINYDYNEEWVAAYGFHPSVLVYNGFNNVDRYVSCHSLRDQKEFRTIIAPALEIYPEYKEYYDYWGGKMYLFGELSYDTMYDASRKISPDNSYPLYIDVESFKKYKGKYIISRAAISNADEIGLEFVKDYDSESSIYHLYLYRAI